MHDEVNNINSNMNQAPFVLESILSILIRVAGRSCLFMAISQIINDQLVVKHIHKYKY